MAPWRAGDASAAMSRENVLELVRDAVEAPSGAVARCGVRGSPPDSRTTILEMVGRRLAGRPSHFSTPNGVA